MFKRKKIGLITAKEAIKYYYLIPIRLVDMDMINAMKIYYYRRIYAYDAHFLEGARNLKSPLITLDAGLSAIAKMRLPQSCGII